MDFISPIHIHDKLVKADLEKGGQENSYNFGSTVCPERNVINYKVKITWKTEENQLNYWVKEEIKANIKYRKYDHLVGSLNSELLNKQL